MSKIRKEALGNLDEFEDFQSWPSYEAEIQARRVLLLEKAYRYQRAAMRLRNYFENDAAWAMSNGVARGDDWYWWVIDACELNANVIWTKAADLYRQAEDL